MKTRAGQIIVRLLLVLAAFPLLGEAPLAAEPLPLAVPAFARARLLLASKPGPRPLVVGLHGNFDRPEWFCESLETLLEGRAVAVCPRGIPRTDVPRELDRWTFPARQRVRSEIEAGIRAARGRPGVLIAEGPVLLAGFSLGAIIASRLAVEEPARFPVLYLVEGGHAVWTAPALRRFAAGGGRGLLLGCGRAGCAALSKAVCERARRLRLGCQIVTAKNLGHSYTAPLPELARPALRTLLEGDRRW